MITLDILHHANSDATFVMRHEFKMQSAIIGMVRDNEPKPKYCKTAQK